MFDIGHRFAICNRQIVDADEMGRLPASELRKRRYTEAFFATRAVNHTQLPLSIKHIQSFTIVGPFAISVSVKAVALVEVVSL